MRVIITGGSGMVGKGVLLECLDHAEVDEVLSIGRAAVGISHPKLKEVEHRDFLDFSAIRENLKGYDACFFCLGVSAGGMNEADYTRITHDFTLQMARTLVGISPNLTFVYVSGEGTDSTEKDRMMWARVKGRTENQLLALGFRQAFMLRPGMIIPLRGITSRTKAYQFLYDYFMWLVKLVKWIAPTSVVTTTQIGLAMIQAAKVGYAKHVLRPSDILQLANANQNQPSKG